MRIHAVPQSRGAVNDRAALLPAGCRALAELAGRVLHTPVAYVEQRSSASELLDGVAHRATLVHDLVAQQQAVSDVREPVLTVGGDCGVELAPVRAARSTYGAGLAVVWFDAHPDLNVPGTSPSGAFHGMVLRALLGEGDPDLAEEPALSPGHAFLVGVRSIDATEQEPIDRGLAVVPDDLAVALAGVEHVYVHVDLDVLDPTAFAGLNYPEPGGLTIAELVAALDSLASHHVVGAGLTECVGTAEEVVVLTPVLEALGRLLG